jgi:integrase
MPRYKKDLEFLARLPDPLSYIRIILERIKSPEYKTYIALLYLSGARPAEMQILYKENIKVIGENVTVLLQTVKRGFPRTLIFDKEKTPFFNGLILPYWANLFERDRAFKKDISTYKKIVYKYSDNYLTPYSFRHFRMTKLAELGAFETELKYWKGAKDFKSVEPYIHRSGKMVERFKGMIV